MTKLEKLLEELCPEGVEFRPLLSVADVLYGYPCDASLFNTDGMGMPLARIRDVLAGRTDTYTVEQVPEKYILSCGDLLVGMDGNFHVANWKTDGGILCQRVCKIYSKDEAILLNGFLSHLLKPIMKRIEDNKQGGTVKHLLDKDIKAIAIPAPPLPVQSEIVRILDNLTKLTAELTAKLTAELIARKQQYEYYRDQLLTFCDDVPLVQLGDYFPNIRNGFVGTATSYFTTAENGVRYLKGTNIHNGIISDNDYCYITPEFHQKHIRNELKADDILVVQSGHVGECAVVGDKYAGSNCHALIIMSNGGRCNSKFVVHYLHSMEGKKKIAAITTGGTVKHILASEMKKFTIPFPPLEEQNRIVAILDQFDSLCNDITEGLSAEIEARQKQYEYYRDKLLTFTEFSA